MHISKFKFYFIWGISGAIAFTLEFIVFSAFRALDSLYYGVTIAVTFFIWYLFRDLKIKGLKQRNIVDIDLYHNATKNYDYSQKYTEVTRPYTHADLEIFQFQTINKSNRSVAFTTPGMEQKIFVYERFFDQLTETERKALILHETHHFIKKDILKTYVMGISTLFFIFICILSLILLVLSGIGAFNILFATVAFSGLLLSITFLKLHLISIETSADRFAAKIMNTSLPIISVIGKAVETMKQLPHSKDVNKWQRIYQMRKEKLERSIK